MYLYIILIDLFKKYKILIAGDISIWTVAKHLERPICYFLIKIPNWICYKYYHNMVCEFVCKDILVNNIITCCKPIPLFLI